MIYRHMDGESLIPDSKGKEFPTFLDRFNAVFGVLMVSIIVSC